MVMKKIIAFIICLALCVTGLAVGVMNRQANTDATIGAAEGALVATDSDAGSTNSLGTVGATNPGEYNGDEVTGPAEGEELVGSWFGGKLIQTDATHFYLIGDIELNAGNKKTDLATLSAAFGSSNTEGATFDGQGHKITTSVPVFDQIGGSTTNASVTVQNLTIAGNIEVDPAGYANGVGALACYLSWGPTYLNNVNITASINVTTTTDSFVGGFLGSRGSYNTNLYMTNCAFSGSITNAEGISSYAGGVIGKYGVGQGDIEMTNCTIDSATINGGSLAAGGVVGMSAGVRSRNIVLTNCKIDVGNLTASANCGGIVGDNSGDFMNINLTNSELTSNVSGATNVGGVIGSLTKPATITIKGTALQSNIKALDDGTNTAFSVGGVIGAVKAVPDATNPVSLYVGKDDNGHYSTLSGIIENLDASGNAGSRDGGFVGGLIGLINTSHGDANYERMSYVVDGLNVLPGAVVRRTSNANSYMGGLFGEVYCKAKTFEIKNVNFAGTVLVSKNINTNVGGIVGHDWCTITDGMKFENVVVGVPDAETGIIQGGIVVERDENQVTNNLYVGGFIGWNSGNNTLSFVNCVNNSDMILTKGAASVTAGGFVAAQNVGYNVTFVNCENNGDIIFKTTNASNAHHMAGGFFAWLNATATIKFEKCINTGDIAASRTGYHSSNCVSAAGFVAHFMGNNAELNVTKCVNTGDVYCSDNISVPKAASLLGYDFRNNAVVTVDGFINAGTLTATNDGFTGDSVTGIDTAKDVYTVDTTNFATADDEETLGVFNATLNADFVATAKSIATAMGETAQVGAIITLDSYVGKIGEFTHEAFDAFYAEHEAAIKARPNASNVDCLYMATDVVELGNDTGFKITLNGATTDTSEVSGYTAVTFVKIGDLYIYSK